MKRGRLPLTALRSFEAAARHASFTKGAEELCISQAAISRQVRELEARLGRSLFERRHRAVVLTPEGERLMAVVREAFDAMAGALDAVRATPSAAPVGLSAEPSFAACWLVPHLADFRAACPGVEVSIEADSRLADFRSGGIQLAIRYSAGRSAWPGVEARPLMAVEMIAVASPDVLASGPRIRTPEDILGRTLLSEENRDIWRQWLSLAGVGDGRTGQGPIFTDEGLILQAAVRGHGIALINAAFAAETLADGRLVRLFPVALPLGAYHLVARSFAALPPEAAAFAAWVEDRCARPSPSPARTQTAGRSASSAERTAGRRQ